MRQPILTALGILLSTGLGAARADFAEFPVATGPAVQRDPAVCDGLVVWTELNSGNNSIMARFLPGGSEFLVDSAYYAGAPAVDAGVVVWADRRNSPDPSNFDVYAYVVSSGQVIPVSTAPLRQVLPDVDGDWVVWQDERNGDGDPYNHNTDIYGRNLATGEERVLSAPPHAERISPRISGRYVVWQHGGLGTNNWDIYGYDLQTGSEFPIGIDPWPQVAPAVSGDIVVWMDYRSGFADIYGMDLATGVEFPICAAPGEQGSPAIDGNIVVWVDFRDPNPDGSGNANIYGYDLTTGTEFAICTDPGYQGLVQISGNLVVWEDERNSMPDAFNVDIYGAYIPEPSCAGLVALALLPCLAGRRPPRRAPPPPSASLARPRRRAAHTEP